MPTNRWKLRPNLCRATAHAAGGSARTSGSVSSAKRPDRSINPPLKIMKILTALFAASVCFGAVAELPRVYVDTALPASSGAIIRVQPGGNLQAALDAAKG